MELGRRPSGAKGRTRALFPGGRRRARVSRGRGGGGEGGRRRSRTVSAHAVDTVDDGAEVQVVVDARL